MVHDLNITVAQINPTLGDLGANAEKILSFWRKAEDAGADLVVFPELALCGYPPQDLVQKPAFLDATKAALKEITRGAKPFETAALIGAPVASQSRKPYNAVHLIEGGNITATRYKHHLPNYGVFDEKRIFKAAEMPAPIDFRGIKLGVMICEDMWFADVSAHLKHAGAQILIVPNASPFRMGKHDIRMRHAKTRAGETNLPLIYAHMVGGQDELVFDGGSFAVDASGAVVRQAPFFEETLQSINVVGAQTGGDVLSITIDSRLRGNDGGVGIVGDEIEDVDAENEKAKNGESKNNGSETDGNALALAYAALKMGIADYVNKNGFKGVLIGLSGGIDSALTAALAVDALGADRVTCVMMPSQYTSQDSLDDASALAENLGAALDNISITDTVAALNNAIPADSPSIAFENIQSRARGVILMALSNASGKMVLTTGNKSEMAVGYATLYGDMCGGFNALKDVYKTLVYDLSRWRNTQSFVMPERIITKAPTAELKDNQTDQDSLPPYDVLDALLQGFIEDDLSIDDMVKKGFDADTAAHIYKLLHRAEYKRNQSAPGTKITTRAFDGDRRYPMTNGFKG